MNVAPQLEALLVDVDELHELPGNPRRGDVSAVARSLAAFGQRKPIVAQLDGTVIAGNHTLKAARLLGWPKIAVVRVDDDETTAQAFALADNRTAELGGYDDGLLAEMLANVADLAPDLLAATGWSDEQLERMLTSEPGDASSDNVPEMWGVVVDLSSEREQIALLERLVAEGYHVRALLS